MARSILLRLLGEDASATRALRNVGDAATDAAEDLDRLNRSAADADDSNQRAEQSSNLLGDSLRKLAPAAGDAARMIGMGAAAIGTAVPAAAGLGAALAAVAPAAAVAATGIGAAVLAGAALQVGMVGVGDAITEAFTGDDPAKLAEALEKLSPQARQFVGVLQEMKPALGDLQTSVQDALFDGLGPALQDAATVALPALSAGLQTAAEHLNNMAVNALGVVRNLAEAGTLQDFFAGANEGLGNLERIPGQIMAAIVQIGTAAAPLFDRLTEGLAQFADGVSRSLAEAFADGRMEAAIEQAAALFGQLVDVGLNVGQVLGNIFGAANADGIGFLGTLEAVTAELAKATASAEVQEGLSALFETFHQLATTAAPLLGQALQQLGPVLQALAPGAQALIAALGEGLEPIIAALGPVLTAAAEAVSELAIAFAPLLPVIGELIAGALPVLTPFFETLAEVFEALAPVVQELAENLTNALGPIMERLPELAEPLAEAMGQLALEILPLLSDLLVEMGPSLGELADAFLNVFESLEPLLPDLVRLGGEILTGVTDALPPIVEAVGELATMLSGQLGDAINDVVIPALETLASILEGDLEGSVDSLVEVMEGGAESIVDIYLTLPVELGKIMARLAVPMIRAVVKGMQDLVQEVAQGVKDAVNEARKLPGMARAALGNLGGVLVAAGRDLVQGLVRGIVSAIPGLDQVLEGITSRIPIKKGPPEKDRVLLYPAGQLVIQGFAAGMSSMMPAVEKDLGAFTDRVTAATAQAAREGAGKVVAAVGSMITAAQGVMTVIDVGKDIRKKLLGDADDIADAIKEIRKKVQEAFRAGSLDTFQRDSLIALLGDSNKKLQELADERQKILDQIAEAKEYAVKVTKDALDFAALTGIRSADEDRAAPTGAEMVAGLQARLAGIREFGANLAKLARAGLSKSLLRQIIDAGLDGGAAIAAELANGPNSIINALNSVQADIEEVADKLGLDTADALFDAGGEAGKGFLTGLEAAAEEIFDAIKELVDTLVANLKTGFADAAVEIAQGVANAANAGSQAVAAATAVYNGKAAPAAPAAPKAQAAPQVKAQPPAAGRPIPIFNVNGVTIRKEADVGKVMKAAAFNARSAAW